MLKNKFYLLLSVFLLITANTFAALPPKYLQVDGFQNCLKTKDMGTWQSYCIPKNKPKFCKESSWQQLQTMNLPAC